MLQGTGILSRASPDNAPVPDTVSTTRIIPPAPPARPYAALRAGVKWVLLAGMFLPVVSLAEDRTPAPLPPAKAVASMIVSDGFKVSLVAAEPDVVQPISFTIDSRGRLWVADALNYGEWKSTGKDRIVILAELAGAV